MAEIADKPRVAGTPGAARRAIGRSTGAAIGKRHAADRRQDEKRRDGAEKMGAERRLRARTGGLKRQKHNAPRQNTADRLKRAEHD